MTTIKVEQRIGKEIKDVFVNVPDLLYDNALEEKKECVSLNDYCQMDKSGRLFKHYKLYNYIENIIGKFMLLGGIERIHIKSK